MLVRVIGSNSRCVKADIIPQHLPSADLGPYMRTHIETTAVGGLIKCRSALFGDSSPVSLGGICGALAVPEG